MKRILVILPFLLVLAACSANPDKQTVNAKIETISSDESHLNEIIEVASPIIFEILELEGIGRNAMVIDPKGDNPYIEIIRLDGKELVSEENQRVQEQIQETVYSKTNVDFKVTLRSQTKTEIRDNSWQPIFNDVTQEMEKQFEEYRGFGYSFSPEPLQIIIKTDLKNNKSTSNLEKINEIQQFVTSRVEQKIEELAVEEIPYKIIIRSKENDDLNSDY
ncbi:hypothetical protein M3649_09055 [Ureibacillus chungkukjangi]|uniref:hypothetical protein n=1 Tax=Ureibacillus chungkukjangi TaxID=1202712 RepID=UPI00203A6D74|nr:hypothetical protein [Ureibacillus chungkukjangi]MCM3388280.1 hypothetical protein [Ureibacillus chungkukjangi]